MKLELTEQELIILSYDIPKLISYYEGMVRDKNEDMQALTLTHLETLHKIHSHITKQLNEQ